MGFIFVFIMLGQLSTAWSAGESDGPSFKISCQIEFKDDKGNIKKKDVPVTLEGHFDDPSEKCSSACTEKACKVLGFSIKGEPI